MNFLRKPFVAMIISAIFVISSTLLSVHIKLGAECREITDGFVDGIEYNGEYQNGIAYDLRRLNDNIKDIADIAATCGIDTDELLSLSEDLRLGLTYSSDSASYLYYCYEELLSELKSVNSQLAENDLGDQNKDVLSECNAIINEAQSSISKSAYNETVRQFIKENRGFPTEILADLAGVYMPEYFA